MLHTNHDRRCVRIAGRHFWHDARIGHPYTTHPSDPQLIVDHSHRIIRRAHLAGTCLMILGRGVVTNRTRPISIATEFQMFAVFHRSSVQLKTVPKTNLSANSRFD